jgi:chromosome segregation ATPase
MTSEILKNKNEALSTSLDLLTKEQQKLKLEMSTMVQNESLKNLEESTLDTSKVSLEEGVRKDSNVKGVLKQLKESLDQASRKALGLEDEVTGLRKELQSREDVIRDMRAENEVLEMEINKVRNSTNLNNLALDEIKNKYEKEKMLRMLDKEGLEQMQTRIGHKDEEIEKLKVVLEKLKKTNLEQGQVIQSMGRQLDKNITDLFSNMNLSLDQSARVITCMKEEISTLKENKVFILNSGANEGFEQNVYLSHLQMGVHDNSKLWFGSQLFESGKKKPKNWENSKHSGDQILETEKGQNNVNSSLFGNQNLSGQRSFKEPPSEMESILQSKLDILEDERESLMDTITQKERHIRTLNEKYNQSKKLIEENLEIIQNKEREMEVQQNMGNPFVSKKIREKSKFVLKLLKIGYGACIDLFLKLDKESLVKLEKKLNNCIQVYHELNELIFSE